MTFRRLKPFLTDYTHLPEPIRKKVERTLRLLAEDAHHPSLRVRKLVNQLDIYEARVDLQYRMTFQLDGTMITLRRARCRPLRLCLHGRGEHV